MSTSEDRGKQANHQIKPIMVLEPTCKLRWVLHTNSTSGDVVIILQQWHKDLNGGGEWKDVPIETEKEGV